MQEAEILRHEKELIATVLKQAEIERQRIETLAEAEKQRNDDRGRGPRRRDSRCKVKPTPTSFCGKARPKRRR